MAMTVLNNAGTMSALGQLKKNDTTLGKQLKKVASGMKLNSAGDGASEYSISERMRVRIRALAQDEENVQTGARLLHTAEGGIQNQIDILKTIKAKVIDANNDTNTDSDRATIQKEINQGYQQIQDIATETSYNGRRVLFGGTFNEKITVWDEMKEPKMVPGSDLGIVPDKYDKLDGIAGPFDIFDEYEKKGAELPILKLQAVNYFSGATPGTHAVYTMDFSGYSDVASLDNVGFSIDGETYVITSDTRRNYLTPAGKDVDHEINISGCTTVGDALDKICAAIDMGGNTVRNGMTIEQTSKIEGVDGNLGRYGSFAPVELTVTTTYEPQPAVPDVRGTGYFTPQQYLSGGKNGLGGYNPLDPDEFKIPGARASLTKNISGVKAGTGITVVTGSGGLALEFVEGSSGFAVRNGRWTVGVNGNDTIDIFNADVVYKNGVLSVVAKREGVEGNSYYVKDGIRGRSGSAGGTFTTHYTGGTAFTGMKGLTTPAVDGTHATLTLDLTNVPDTTDAADIESTIEALQGYGIEGYEFIDGSNPLSLNDYDKMNGIPIDLNELRTMVGGSMTVRAALRSLLVSSPVYVIDKTNSNADQIVYISDKVGSAANKELIDVWKEQLRHYDVDFGSWMQSHPDVKIPEGLYDKGFRWYCASDADHWFNIVFTDGSKEEEERPRSSTAEDEIRTIAVDVSKVTDASSLVTAIYEQSMKLMTSHDPYYDHLHRMKADPENGILTVYDYRQYRVDTPLYDYQEKGAKIADGVMDNVVKSTKDMLVDQIIIQHTDKASMNIRINIPRTTIDHIFTYVEDYHDVSEYNVMTKEMREKMLGKPPAKGILDKGIQYLTDANTLVGAQTNHLMFAHENIKTQQESTQASESTIRDSDMAKEMTNYTKANVLAQSAQAMLAQANSNAGNVISLLQ